MAKLDSYQWFVELREEHRERVLRLLGEAPGHLHDLNEVTISIQPMGGVGMTTQGPRVTMSQLIPIQGGVELLRWKMEQMVEDLILAKSKSLTPEEEADG